MSTQNRTVSAVIAAITVIAAFAMFHLMNAGSVQLQRVAGQAGTSVAAGPSWNEPSFAMSGVAHNGSRQTARMDGSAPVLLASAD